MRILLVVGDRQPPGRLAVRSDRVLHTSDGGLDAGLLADVRAHIPEDVAVTGPARAATAVAHASSGSTASPSPSTPTGRRPAT